MKTLQEKIAIAFEVLGEIVTAMPEEELDARMLQAFEENEPETYNSLQAGGLDTAAMVEQAYENFSLSSDENIEDNGTGDISTDAYTKPGSQPEAEQENKQDIIPNEIKSDNKEKPKTRSRREVVTKKLANSLPTAASDMIEEYVTRDFEERIQTANSTEIDKFLINTPVRNNLIGKTFVVSDDVAQKFLEKYERLVVNDNQLDPNDKSKVIAQGENMKAFADIKSMLNSHSPFKVNVPAVSSQKVIGVKLVTHTGSGDIPKVLSTKNLPITVLLEYGGQIPGDPGIRVKDISPKKTKKESEVEEYTFVMEYVGKSKALKGPEGKESKYIEHTSEELNENEAINKYGIPKKSITVKSELKFKVNVSGKVRTVRVSGKIDVPFFVRKQEYFAEFGEPESRKFVAELTMGDRDHVAELIKAFANTNANIVQKAFNLDGLVAAMDAANAEPTADAIIDDKAKEA